MYFYSAEFFQDYVVETATRRSLQKMSKIAWSSWIQAKVIMGCSKPAFATLRQEVFENHEPDDLSEITDHQLGRFISESNYRWFPHDEEPEDPG